MSGKEFNNLTTNVRREFHVANQEVKDKYGGKYELKAITNRFDNSKVLHTFPTLANFAEELGGFVMPFYLTSRTVDSRFMVLQKADYARLMFLATYISHKTGKLVYDNGVSMSKDHVKKELGLSKNKFNEFWNRCIGEDALWVANGYVYVNPTLFYKGSLKEFPESKKGLSYTKMYIDTVRNLYAEYGSGRSITHLSVIYALLPFLHPETMILAYNPEEPDVDLVNPISLDGLALALEYSDSKKLKAILNKVRLGDETAFVFYQNPNDLRKIGIIMNAKVYFNSTEEALKLNRMLFSNKLR